MKIFQITTFEKISKEMELNLSEFNSFTALKNERFAYRSAIRNDSNEKKTVKVQLKTELDCVDVRNEGFVYVNRAGCSTENKNDEYAFATGEVGYVSDALLPIEDGFVEIPANENAILFVTAHMDTVPTDAGKYDITVALDWDDGSAQKTFTLDVIDALLPEKFFMYTNWFHCDSIAYAHNEKVFTERYWRLLESYMLAASRVGMNMILTPIITPPLDTAVGAERLTVQLVDVEKVGDKYYFEFSKLRRWVRLAQKCGMKYFEMAHLFTQWGAKCTPKVVVKIDGKEEKLFGWHVEATDESYVNFLDQLLPQLVEVIKDMGIEKNTFFHVSDEPQDSMLEQYLKCKAIITKHLNGFRIMDALSHPEFVEQGVSDYPIPITCDTHRFTKFDLEHRWTYYCCGPEMNASNRFIAQYGWVTRALGSQLFKFDIQGFLHWGFNFYFTCLSRQFVSPYEKNEYENFPQGDGCIVYPHKDGAVDSLRGQLMYDAFQDQRALDLLAEKLGREAVKKLLDDIAGMEVDFNHYPHNGEFILNWRSAVNEKIRELYA